MEIVILPSASEIAKLVADKVQKLLKIKPNLVLGLATGSTPIPIYDELVARYEQGLFSFSKVRAFLLDEYVNLPFGHPQSYLEVIRRCFVNRLDIDPNNVHAPDGTFSDMFLSCSSYESKIKESGGVDLQILGIGIDGHIAFNEQGSSLVSRTRVKTLTERTRQDNARFFNSTNEVPRHVVTQGLGTIMDAEHIVLVATGISKAKAVANTVEGAVSASCPASILQMHKHVTVVLDDASASDLERQDYYRSTFSAKPSWQSI